MTYQQSETTPLLSGAEPAVEQPRLNAVPYPSDLERKPSTSAFSSASDDSLASVLDADDILRDTIIGFSDGLTVPFALTAGLSSLGSARVVILAGLAELFSGMISMGLGAYLAAATERDAYTAREEREALDVKQSPSERRADVFALLDRYGVSPSAAGPLVDELCAKPEALVRFMLDLGLRLERPSVHRAWVSAVTMGVSYFVGGLIPMLPYFLMARVREALFVSVAVTVAVLLAFGYIKNYVAIRNHRAGFWGALQTLVIGMLAAGTSYAIVRALDRKDQ